MTKIATGSYLQSLATNGGGGSLGLTSSKCYTYQSILELNGFLISSVLDNDRLVKESLISYSIPSVTHYYAYGPWYWDVNTSSTIYINSNYSHRSDISNNFLSNFTQIDKCAIVFEKYDNTNNRYYFEFDDGLLTGNYDGKFTLFDITSNGSNIAVNNNTPILADSAIDTYSKQVGGQRQLLGGLIDESSDQEYDSEINDLLSSSYVIPIKYNDYSYLQFFESIDGSHGWFDPMLGNSNKHIFIPYSTQDYYVTGVYNNVSCVFKFRLRYFTNSLSGGINIDSLINGIPSDTYQYGSAGDIFSNYNLNTYTHNNFTGSTIGTAEISQDDGYGNIEFYDDIDRPSLRYNGNFYNRLTLGSYIQNGSISWNGSTYPLYDATNILVSAPQDGINVNTGGSGGSGGSSSTVVERYEFYNYSSTNDIYVYKINNIGQQDAVYTYLGYIGSGVGSFNIELTQDDIDNANTRGFAFGCDIGSITDITQGGIVSIYAEDALNSSDFYNSNTDQYDFTSYDTSISVGGLPLYDRSFSPYTLQYININQLRGLDYWTTNDDTRRIGLSNYTNIMNTDIDFEVLESSGESVTVYLSYDYNEESSRTIYPGSSDYLTMEEQGYSYYNYQISFDHDVELYYKQGNSYYPINLGEGADGPGSFISSGTYLNIDSIRGAAQGGPNSGISIDSYIYIKVI